MTHENSELERYEQLRGSDEYNDFVKGFLECQDGWPTFMDLLTTGS